MGAVMRILISHGPLNIAWTQMCILTSHGHLNITLRVVMCILTSHGTVMCILTSHGCSDVYLKRCQVFRCSLSVSRLVQNTAKFLGFTVKILGIKVPCTLGRPYTEGTYYIVTISFGFILYCGCFNLFCNVWVYVCVGVLVICVLCCVVCTVFLFFVYVYLFLFILSVLV